METVGAAGHYWCVKHSRWPAISAEEIEAQAQAWMSSIDPAEKVGARHHTVPRFYLARFADRREQLQVRDRATGAATSRSIKDLAVKDFYTIVHVEGHLDSSFEQLLSVIEAQAAGVLKTHLNSFMKPRPFGDDERSWLGTFVAFQFIRGNRERRNASAPGSVRYGPRRL
jgi:hypothetical protein